jgi:site-specific DNA-methyltransferase (adenine-specific)
MKNKDLFTSNSNEWYTPQPLFDKIQEVLDIKFTLDPCATKESAKCKKYYIKEDNGLLQDWSGEIVFINPPYSRDLQPKFIKKAVDFSILSKDCSCTLLIPARTDTKIWHEYIFKYASKILFIKGRIKFQTMEDGELVYKQAATFPSAIVMFDGSIVNQVIGTFEQ